MIEKKTVLNNDQTEQPTVRILQNASVHWKKSINFPYRDDSAFLLGLINTSSLAKSNDTLISND